MLGSVRKHSLDLVPPPPKKKTKRTYPESDDQKRVVQWIRKRDNWLVMRMENALQRTPAQAARDQALGMEPGAPDLMVMYRAFGFFLEMKTVKGKVSEEQEKLHAQLRARGCTVMVGWGSEATIRTLEKIEVYWSHHHDNAPLCVGGIQGLIAQGSIRHV
jgi:hypothetical protein